MKVGDAVCTIPCKKGKAYHGTVVKVIEHSSENPLKNPGRVEVKYTDVVGWLMAPHHNWEKYLRLVNG